MPRPPVQAITTVPQWLRCAHTGTALLAGPQARGLGVVTLASTDPGATVAAGTEPGPPAGLAIGADCWVYHAIPEQGRIVRLPWRPDSGAGTASGGAAAPPAEDLLVPAGPARLGDFHTAFGEAPAPIRAVALAFAGTSPDEASRLVALDADGWLYQLDLMERRVVRRLRIDTPAPAGPGPWTPLAEPATLIPVDLASVGGPGLDGVLVACASRAHPLWLLRWYADPVELAVPDGPLVGLPDEAEPARVAADGAGRIWLLWRAAGNPAWATPVRDDRFAAACGPLPDACDLELDGDGALVVAGPPGADLRVFRFADGTRTEDRPLRARRADGRGIVRTPDGRIAFWTGAGLRTGYGAPVSYGRTGMVITYALDSGVFRQRWRRIFVDACLPAGTGLTVSCLSADDLPGDELDGALPAPGESLTIAATPPVNAPDPPDLAPGPPMPAAEATFGPPGPVYRRRSLDQPWTRRPADDPFVTYEAPVNADPGRYLWLRLNLSGTTKAAPRIRAIRVETAGPHLLEKLPRVFSEDATAAAFLDRYLELLNGPLADLGAAADARHVLLDPAAAPMELLPWLASLVGLVLDERWPEAARRTLLAEAVYLFRRRGTIGALLRMLEIVLGVRPVLVEGFRFRGLTGSTGTTLTRAGSSFAEYAHRFSVVVPGMLSANQLAVVRDLLDAHRPAHTVVEVCSAATGSRVGIGLHLELTSVIGKGAGFTHAAVGNVFGRGTVLGRPTGGLTIGAGRIGQDARVEP